MKNELSGKYRIVMVYNKIESVCLLVDIPEKQQDLEVVICTRLVL